MKNVCSFSCSETDPTLGLVKLPPQISEIELNLHIPIVDSAILQYQSIIYRRTGLLFFVNLECVRQSI